MHRRAFAAFALAAALTIPNAAVARPPPETLDRGPRPGQAANYESGPRRSRSTGQRVAHGLLLVPRWALEAAFAIPRLGMWAVDRFDTVAAYRGAEEDTLKLLPSAGYETGFGFGVGLHARDNRVAGSALSYRLGATIGGPVRQRYRGEIDLGRALAPALRLALVATYAEKPRARFFGIGNSDESGVPPAAPVAPVIDGRLVDRTALETVYRDDDAHAAVETAWAFAPGWTAGARLRLRHRRYRRGESVDTDGGARSLVDDVYLPASVPGLEAGGRNAYAEMDLAFDSRPTAAEDRPDGAAPGGFSARGFAGWQQGWSDDPSRFARWGVDLQRVFDIYGGTRLLTLRGYAEGRIGGYDQIPFTDLVTLGGPVYLRGYLRERFRDRFAAVATLAYTFPVSRYCRGTLFTDAGRVFSSVGAARVEELRFGFGGGIEMSARADVVAQLMLASSVDGGLFVTASIAPAW